MAYSKNRRLAEIISDTSGNLSVQGIVVPTQSSSDNDTSAASTAFVHTHINALVDSAPGTMNTLNEIAAALNDDAAFNTTVTNAIATKAPLASPSLTGTVTVTGASSAYNTLQLTSNSTGHGTIINLGDTSDADYGSITQFASSAGEGGRMRFIAGTTETMNLRGGNVGIGNTNPSDRLVVQKDSANIEPMLVLKNDNTTDDNGISIDFSGHDDGGNDIIYGRIATKITNHATEKSHLIFTHRNDSGALDEGFRLTHDGNMGIGIDSPDGKVHILQGSAGSVTASTDKNTLVVENSTHGGITTLTPDASESGMFFGHASGARTGEIYTKYSDNLMTVGSRKAGMAVRFMSDNAEEVFRLRGDGSGIDFPDNHTFIGTSSSAGGSVFEWGAIRRPASADGGQLTIRQYSSGSTAASYPAYASSDGSGTFDENTGMYFPAADKVGLSGGGSPKLETGPHTDADRAAVKINNQAVHKAGALTVYGGSSTATNGGVLVYGGSGRYYEHVVQNHTSGSGNRYWHIETNITTSMNIMFYAHFEGYAYGNSGNYASAVRTGYMYAPNSAVINTVQHVTGSTGGLDIYNSSNNRLTFRCDFGGGYYSGGKFSIGFPSPAGYSHDFQVVSHGMNSTSGSHF